MRDVRQNIPGPAGAARRPKAILLFVLLVFVVAAVSSCGCIKLVQKSLDGSNGPGLNGQSGISGNASTAVSLQRTIKPGSRVTAGTGAAGSSIPVATPPLVVEAAPVLEGTTSPVQHVSRNNRTEETARFVRLPEFTRIYSLRGNAIGLLANVTTGPLIIGFDIEPEYDCIEDPDSCRGTSEKTVTRPYCLITVRENGSLGIIARDGYGKEYSSDKLNRTVTVYGQGVYHITIEGNALDVTLSLTTGASPLTAETKSIATGAGTTRSQDDYENILRHREGG